jgi:DNA-binding NarL/FixJ family response regulator
MTKLAIVDDDVSFAKALKSELLDSPEIESVLSCNSGLRFFKELEKMPVSKIPDVILMDISMDLPNEGVVATGLIKRQFPQIGVIMFTISDEDERIFDAFLAGATGYLLKNESPGFILKSILDVKDGGAQMSPSIARKTIQLLAPVRDAQKREALELASAREQLSERELEILGLVAKGHTYDRIAENLNIASNTVKKHVSNIFQKLHVSNKVEAIKKVPGIG